MTLNERKNEEFKRLIEQVEALCMLSLHTLGPAHNELRVLARSILETKRKLDNKKE